MINYYSLFSAGNFFALFLSHFQRGFITYLRRRCHIASNSNAYLILGVLVAMAISLSTFPSGSHATEIRVASFNVSMEGSNYGAREAAGDGVLATILSEGTNAQVKNIAAVIQRTRPDIILLNEFDYIANAENGVKLFLTQFLNRAQTGSEPIDYPYYFLAPVNTGEASPFDLDGDGLASGRANDAWGFGHYPGQYGMLLLSRFPIDTEAVRTFQLFKWADLPGAIAPVIDANEPYYNSDVWDSLRLSSKSHWDIPVQVNGDTVHVLASHPTPPVFDGPERRNALRNRDEIRFWSLYIDRVNGAAIYDDTGVSGGLAEGTRFVIVGDLNASADEGDSLEGGIEALLGDAAIQGDIVPASEAAVAHSPQNPFAGSHTAHWGMRADYVLPSVAGFEFLSAGVFWPSADDPDAFLVRDRGASSDHRLVWVDLRVKTIKRSDSGAICHR
jgi:hypothetical protein